WCGALLLGISLLAVVVSLPADFSSQIQSDEKVKVTSPLKPYIASPGAWDENPLDAFFPPPKGDQKASNRLLGTIGAGVIIGLLFAVATQIQSGKGFQFLLAYPVVFGLAVFAYLLAGQSVIKHYNLEYVLWAIFVGMLISNTIGTPTFLRPALLTEFFIKTGLVLLGAEVLFSRLLALGVPGIFVSWIVTPIVLT